MVEHIIVELPCILRAKQNLTLLCIGDDNNTIQATTPARCGIAIIAILECSGSELSSSDLSP